MRRTPYSEFTAFIAVAEQRNFTRAARQMGVSTATLSQTIRSLEEKLGIRLLNRTTRSVAPTEAGERLLLRLKPLLEEYAAAIDSLNEFRDKPAGVVRLTVAPPAAHSVLAPRLREFFALYPEIRLEISVDAGSVDIVSHQFDAGIRRETSIDRDMIAVRVSGEMDSVVVGSPAYLAEHPPVALPADLQAHNCLRVRLAGGTILPWHFGKGGKNFDVAVSGALVGNDVDLMISAALDGVGLLYLPRAFVIPYLRSGRLVSLLDGWTPPAGSFFLYYPSWRQTAAALRALIEFLRYDEKFASAPVKIRAANHRRGVREAS